MLKRSGFKSATVKNYATQFFNVSTPLAVVIPLNIVYLIPFLSVLRPFNTASPKNLDLLKTLPRQH
jgi:hypothetical protein